MDKPRGPPSVTPTVSRRLAWRASAIIAAVLFLVLACAPAFASTADEVRHGQALAEQLQAGTTSCAQFGTDDFEQLGEYVMGRMTGSLQLHEAMNARMRSALGASTEERMHVLMGRRYAGCGAQGSGGMGPGMMSGSGWDRMMSSGMWGWMGDGRWQRMSSGDWRRVAAEWMGPGMMRVADHHGRVDWPAIALGAIAFVLAGGALGGVFVWRARRRAHVA